MVYVLSANEHLKDVVCAAVKDADVFQAAEPSALVGAILGRPTSRHICVIIDLSTVANAEDFIRLLQGRPQMSLVPVIVLGTPGEVASLNPELKDRVKAILTVPYSPVDLAVVLSIC